MLSRRWLLSSLSRICFFEEAPFFSLFRQKYNSPFLGHARRLFHLDAKNDGLFHTLTQATEFGRPPRPPRGWLQSRQPPTKFSSLFSSIYASHDCATPSCKI